MLNNLLILSSILLLSCGTPKIKLTSDGMKVKVLKRKPGKECSVLAKVVGENDQGSIDLAQNHARNLVANQNGNSIYFDEEVSNGNKFSVHATGYNCK